MNITDWRMIGVMVQILSAMITIGIFCIIKFNDLKHLALSLKNIVTQLQENTGKLDGISDRISYIEGFVGVNRIVRKKKKSIKTDIKKKSKVIKTRRK